MARNAVGLTAINIPIKAIKKPRKSRELDKSIDKILCVHKFIKLQKIFQNIQNIDKMNKILLANEGKTALPILLYDLAIF